MNTRRRGILIVVLVCAALLIPGVFIYSILDARTGNTSVQVDDVGRLLQVIALVKTSYVDPVDTSDLVRSYVKRGTINGMLYDALDAYTRYMDPRTFSEMQVETSGEFSGIGIVITLYEDEITIVSPIRGTPGFRAGLKTGDRIIAIDGKSTENMSVTEAVDLMRGPEGTPVRITIERGEEEPYEVFDVDIIRANIEVPAIPKAEIIEGNIGYVSVVTFSERTAEELKAELARLDEQGMEGLILDLRGNPGGLLKSAVDVANLFISDGPIVHIVGRDGDKESIYAFPEGTRPEIPMVVLVDKGSASASEIVSGALKDTGKATLVGTTTFGKGLVQTVIPLPDGAALSLTTARYLTAGGHSIDQHGVDPDIVVEVSEPESAAHEGAGSDSTQKRQLKPQDDEVDLNDPQIQTAVRVLREKMSRGVAGTLVESGGR